MAELRHGPPEALLGLLACRRIALYKHNSGEFVERQAADTPKA